MASTLLQILPGEPIRVTPKTARVCVSGPVGCGPSPEGRGAMLTFAEGGQITWESAGLLSRPAGSLVLDFLYRAEGYQIDRPVLRVTDRNGEMVLQVSIGRVMFKVLRPPHEFAIDLYLNEREGGWMRTTLTWERIGSGRMYLRTAVNDRPYDRAIVPAFPRGTLRFRVAPETSAVREVAFHERPLPLAVHPLVNRSPSAKPEVESLRRMGFIRECEQAALDARGGVVALVPEGAPTRCLPSGLRAMGLTRFRIVNDDLLPAALGSAAALILADSDYWAPDVRREAAIRRFVGAGGGLLALGASALEVRRMGLVQFEPFDAGCEGATHFRLRPESPVFKAVPGNWMPAKPIIDGFCRQGPHYNIAESRMGEAAAVFDLTQRPCALASAYGRGRVVLSAFAPFGYYFWRPRFEGVGGAVRNALPYICFKSLLFHAASVPVAGPDAPDLPTPVPVPIPARAGATAACLLSPARLSESESVRREDVCVGAQGMIRLRLRADTLHLASAEPRSLLHLSGGENSLHLYYDPREQYLVFEALTPNEECRTFATERTTWDGRGWMDLRILWHATGTGDAAVEMTLNGSAIATGGMPLPTAPLTRLILGAAPGMRGLPMRVEEFAITRSHRPPRGAARRDVAAPVSWEDTPADRAEVQEFQRTHKLALFAETHPHLYEGQKSYDVYGLRFDILFERDLAAGALEKGGYAVLYAPGGGLPEFKSPLPMQDRVRDYVRKGGGYVGICAGMNEASSMWPPEKSANLFRTPTATLGGTELMEIHLVGDHPVLKDETGAFRGAAPAVRFVHMSGSPLRMDTPDPDTAPVCWLGLAPHLAASGSFVYGKGRGIVWCPHPELAGWGWWKPSDRTRAVMRRLFRRSLYFAAGWKQSP